MNRHGRGDIVVIRNNLTEDDLDSVELTWADMEEPLGGLKCRIDEYVGTEGYYKNKTLYLATIITDGRWLDNSWYMPEDWFSNACMFNGVP